MSGRGTSSGGYAPRGGRYVGRGGNDGASRGGRDGGRGEGRGRVNRGGYNGGQGRGRGEERVRLRRLSRVEWEEAAEVSLSEEMEKRLAVSVPQAKVLEPTRRPGVGKLGLRTMVKANHFRVDFGVHPIFHRYHVSIEPLVPKKLNKDIMGALIDNYKNSDLGNLTPAYDGSKTLFTTKQFPFSSKDFSVKLGDARRVQEFKVTIKWTSEVELCALQQFLAGHQLEAPQEMIQVFDVVLRSAERLKNYTPVGRSLFSPSMGRGPLPGGLEFWKGFYESLRPTQIGLSLNIDASARAFYAPISVTEYLDSLGYLPRNWRAALNERDRLKVKKALKGITVEVTHRPNVKRCKVLGLSTQPCNQLMFLSSDGREMSVAQYFYQKYNIALRFPALPCLEVGSTKRPTCLPMEVCVIVEGQRYSKKLNETQVSDLLNATAVRPHQRASQIQRMVEQNSYNGDFLVSNFGLRVHNNFTLVEARVLPQPTLLYNGAAPGATVDASFGEWKMINQRLHEPGRVRFWACVTFCHEMVVATTEQFRIRLLEECARKGMNFDRRPLIPTSERNPEMLERELHDVQNECNRALNRLGERGQQLQLLIIILPDRPESYGAIKRICEIELGIVSQCCKPRKASNPARSYLENLALKINVKVGGRNVVLLDAFNRVIPLVTKDLTMVFGADVTHPQPGEDSTSSIAAVVGSMDWPCFAKYKGIVAAQHYRKEIIGELSGMVRELLSTFKQVNGDLPRRIIFYRDGVSEGEFSTVLLQEMGAIREACQSLEKDYLPPVTFIVVQKRHHTRLFAEDPNMTNRSQNILPGTVVDTRICHPSQFDFYLCSHAGIQGTSRPTHYHVLFDENNFTPDLIQLFTNSLCYTYARCTRSVSLVPPVYYAHLLAFRARFYKDRDGSEAGSSTGAAAQTSRSAIVEVQQLPDIKRNVQNVMFFC